MEVGMDESRGGGMQSGWPGEWPRPEQHAPAPAQTPPVGPAGGARETAGWPDWSDRPEAATTASPDRPGRSPRGALAAVGLVLAGALAGGIGIAAVQHGAGGTTSTAAAPGFGAAGPAVGQRPGQGQLGQGLPGGGFGRDDGEQRLVGTVTTLTGSSLTVRTQSGTATYQVNGDTQVIKDGQPAALSDLASGDQVLLHVLTGGGTPTVERIIAGQPPQPGDGGFPGGRDGDGPQQGDGGPDGPGGSAGSAGGTTTGLRT